jgi:hypothetical protein
MSTATRSRLVDLQILGLIDFFSRIRKIKLVEGWNRGATQKQKK